MGDLGVEELFVRCLAFALKGKLPEESTLERLGGLERGVVEFLADVSVSEPDKVVVEHLLARVLSVGDQAAILGVDVSNSSETV